MDPSKTAGFTFNGGHVGGQAIYESVNPSLSGGGRRKRRTVRKATRSAKRTARRSAKRTARRSAKRTARRSVKRTARRSVKRTARRSAKRTARRSEKRTTRRKNRKRIQGRRAVYRGAGFWDVLRGVVKKKPEVKYGEQPATPEEQEAREAEEDEKKEKAKVLDGLSHSDLVEKWKIMTPRQFRSYAKNSEWVNANIPEHVRKFIAKSLRPDKYLKKAIIAKKRGCLDEYWKEERAEARDWLAKCGGDSDDPLDQECNECLDAAKAEAAVTAKEEEATDAAKAEEKKVADDNAATGAADTGDDAAVEEKKATAGGGSRSSLLPSSKSKGSSDTSSRKPSTKKRRSLGRRLLNLPRHTMKYGLRTKVAHQHKQKVKRMKSDERKAHLNRVRANASRGNKI